METLEIMDGSCIKPFVNEEKEVHNKRYFMEWKLCINFLLFFKCYIIYNKNNQKS